MKAALLAIVLLGLCGCAAKERRLCPPLPELSAHATEQEIVNHRAIITHLYAQCAGAPL